jgi:hypothetical protein
VPVPDAVGEIGAGEEPVDTETETVAKLEPVADAVGVPDGETGAVAVEDMVEPEDPVGLVLGHPVLETVDVAARDSVGVGLGDPVVARVSVALALLDPAYETVGVSARVPVRLVPAEPVLETVGVATRVPVGLALGDPEIERVGVTARVPVDVIVVEVLAEADGDGEIAVNATLAEEKGRVPTFQL